jgi:penicillin-insensitive murein endopeptidase
VRLLGITLLLAVSAHAGCAELGVVGDGTSISVGRPGHGGHIIDGVRLPDRGEGFFTRDVWKTRGNRYGTDELVDLLTGVARRMATRSKQRLVVADLSAHGGGDVRTWHRSHQSGRDVDLLYYMRDRDGKPMEPDAMHVFDATGRAKDGSGITVDVPRTWQLVREVLTAPEAPVQYVFMYAPIASLLIEHARSIGEPEPVVAKARKALRQPGDSARHDDHLHVRVYCAQADKPFGCVDIGPMDLMAEREAEQVAMGGLLPMLAGGAAAPTRAVASAAAPAAPASPAIRTDFKTLGRMLRTRTDGLLLHRFR